MTTESCDLEGEGTTDVTFIKLIQMMIAFTTCFPDLLEDSLVLILLAGVPAMLLALRLTPWRC